MTKWIRNKTSSTNKQVYHTDEDCVMLRHKREVSEREIAYHNLRECQYCASDDDPRPNTDQDRGYYQALQEAAQND
jgi:hypothetical protein